MSEDSNNSDKQKGFSGLSTLVSDIDDITKKKPAADKKTDNRNTSKTTANKNTTQPTRPVESKNQTNKSTQNTYPNNPDNSSSYSWIWVALVVIIVIVIANSDNKSSSKTRYTDTYSKDSNTYNKPSSTAPKQPTETKPSIGRNQVLNTSNIRYCLAEKIRLDGAESVIDNYSQYDVNRFNSMVNDYNSRCGEFRYRSGALGRAERDTKPFHSQYLIEGKSRFVNISFNTKPKPKPKPNPTVLSIQKSLTKLGYSPGPSDGFMGKKTRAAIIQYQKDAGITPDGKATSELLNILNSSPRIIPKTSSRNTKPSSLISLGTHKDMVLQIQGTPDAINRYSDHEVWKYKYSSIEISTRTQRVIEWNNQSNNLRIQLLPGTNTTSSSHITLGSHKDDVIRIQGTPDSINRYSDHEVWKYKYSSIEISTRNHRVTEWNNQSSNLRIRMLPGSNTTGSTRLTRGSHLDDVIRIQGTPDSINRYSDHEVWKYKYSSIEISTTNKRVTEWNNQSQNLKVY